MKTVLILCLLTVQALCHAQNCPDPQTLSFWNNKPLKDLPQNSDENIGTLYLEVKANQDLNGIERLKCIRKLKIEGALNSAFTSFPPSLSRLSSLEELEIRNLKGLNWMEVFKLLENLPKLKKLTIKFSGLTEIPETVILPASLEEIDFRYNELVEFPRSLLKLNKLRILNLEENRLKMLPAGIGGLVNLEKLILRSNGFDRIPSEIGNLKTLNTLELSDCKLEQLPQSIANLSLLTSLYLDYNRLKAIPPVIFKCTNLKILSLSQNRIKKIPSDIAALENLKSLSIEENLLTSLPVELCSLTKLTKLNVANNRLTDLPRHLKQLETFDVRSNHFKTEPELSLFYKSAIDSIRRRFDSISSVYEELTAQTRSFDQAYEEFVTRSLGNRDSLTLAYHLLQFKINQYNGSDYKQTENIIGLTPLILPSGRVSVIDFQQDLDRNHSSYSIARPPLSKK